jgi:hypothetical protein
MEKDEETEKLIKIFVTSIKTAVRRAHGPGGVEGQKRDRKNKQMLLNCGAKRYHYSMFNVGRSVFDVQSV